VWAVQLAKAFGADVTAVDGPAKLDLLRGLGADAVIDYTKEDFTRAGIRYDMVFDIVSQTPFRQVRRALQPDGTFVLIGHDQYGRSGHRVLGSLTRMLPLMALSPVVKQLPPIRSGPPRAENMATITDLLITGRITPVVDDLIFPLDQVVAAMDHLTSGAAQGRVVLTV
jgi:NADPH:quinone reductase-like Zn-dependent oxidoreductase